MLRSLLFEGDQRLNRCLVDHGAHVVPGEIGTHVLLIQDALRAIDGTIIDPQELEAQRYGPSTAAAVLAYKKKRKIINRSYQSTEDNIVGKMTIAALDEDLLKVQGKNNTLSGGVVEVCDDKTLPDFLAQRRVEPPPEGFTLGDRDDGVLVV